MDLTPQFRLLIYLDLDLFGTWIPSWNKDKIYVRSSSVRLISVTRMVYQRAKRALLSVLGIRNYNYRGGGVAHHTTLADTCLFQVIFIKFNGQRKIKAKVEEQ